MSELNTNNSGNCGCGDCDCTDSSAGADADTDTKTEKEFISEISEISHEIKTPINGIMGMTRIAMKNADKPERVTECLEKIGYSSQYLLSLVNNVLDMSRLDAGKAELNSNPFDITAVAERCCCVIQGQLVERKPWFSYSCENIRHPALIGDSLRLSQIIINILGNSVKFTEEGEINFRVTETDCRDGKAVFRFEFEDTGIGMSAEYLPRIFEPFSQDSVQDRLRYNGTGLGMSIVKQYVDLMNGKITVESELNKGTRFVAELAFEIDESPMDSKAETHGQLNHLRLDGETILLAEDNEINAEITAEILQESGADVITASNGKVALDIYSNSEESYFDMILMDVRMPKMDGISAARAIRRLDRTDAREVPIIAITAGDYDEDKRTAIEAGMNAYLSKPINADALLETLENVL